MKSTNIMDPKMTIDAAHDYASRLFDLELRGSSDTDGALFRIEQKYGISPNQLMHLRSRRAKSCGVGLFARLGGAYLDLCERQVTKLQHELTLTKATCDDDLADLEAEAAALASKIAAKKAGLRLARSHNWGGK